MSFFRNFTRLYKKDKNHSFAVIPSPSIPRSTFKRPVNHITAFNSGYLIPVYVDEVIPGDTFKVNLKAFSRLATPTVPLMDNVYIDYHYFYVPFRLLWDNCKKFYGEKDYNDHKEYVMPIINSGKEGVPFNSLFDYMGIPPKVPNLEFNALYFRAYLKIWNDHYRDENLQDEIKIPMGDEDIILDEKTLKTFDLLRRNKRKDYFTSARPDTQKGTTIDLMKTVNVSSKLELKDPRVVMFSDPKSEQRKITSYEIGTKYDGLHNNVLAPDGWHDYKHVDKIVGDVNIKNTLPTLTVTDIRLAATMQQFMERDMRAGNRYNEFIEAHYGQKVPDYMIQRSEYLGGGKSYIEFNSVPQTSSTDSKSPQGNLAAYGTQSADKIGFTASFDEPGLIMCLASVRVDQKYQYGLPKMFSKRQKYDFYYPDFAGLTEQPILNREIFATGKKEEDEKVFGYQERYGEYRYNQNRVSGQLRSTFPQSLDYWHLGQKYDQTPKLNEEFIQENPPIKRSLAVQNEPEIISDMYFEIETTRPMPVYSVPGISKI